MYRNNKEYYNVAGVAAEDVIDNMNMLHREGAALKYLFRNNNILSKGDTRSDLLKCRHYLSRCLQYSAPIRDKTFGFWLEQINPEVFDEDIYEAIVAIIKAVDDEGNYDTWIDVAIAYVNEALKRY